MKMISQSIKMILTLCAIAFLGAPGLVQAGVPLVEPNPEALPAVFLQRLEDASAGYISTVNSTSVGNSQLTTAVRTNTGHLKVIVWRVASDGTFTRKGDKTTYQISSQIASTHLGNGRVVTATRDAVGKLRVSVFQTYANGAIVQKGTAIGSSVSKVAISQIGSSKFVTSVRTAAGHLQVTGWSVNDLGQITKLGSYTDEKIFTVSQTYLSNQRVVCAVRTIAGNLKLITFKLKFGGSIQRMGDSGNQAGAITDVDITANGVARVITSVRQSNNTMKLISWRVLFNGAIQRKESSPSTGAVSDLSIDFDPPANTFGFLYTGTKAANGGLEVTAWMQSFDANTITKYVENKAGGITMVDTTYIPEKNVIVTAVRTAAGILKLISWDIYAVG